MKERKIAVTVGVVATMLIAACSSGGNGVDTRPIGGGLEFLGMSLVLAAIVITFGRWIGR